MKSPVNDDNRYKVGSIMTAYAHPSQKLRLVDYKDRIYYCQLTDEVNGKTLAYYDRELIPTGL
jgi:hypothetical protein